MSGNGCPDERTLRDFALGRVAGDRFDQIAEHVAGCAQCADVLDRDESDGLLTGLRGIDTGAEDPELASELIDRVIHGDERELVVDAGAILARRLEAGPFRLDRFELIEQLGVGSFGYVFRARDCELDRIVALKVQRSSDLDTDADTQRFMREARSAAQLDHPGIVRLYETGRTSEGAFFLVTELVEGESLADAMNATRFAPRDAAALVAAVARALHAAHEQGVVHRDVTPSNILIDRDGAPHVSDFGLAKREAGEVTVTDDGAAMGTPAYMSPEQARDARGADARSDVYSLGVILYELLTGARPFAGNRRMLMLQLLEDEPRPPRQLDDRIPRDLQTICLAAMAKSPARRYATAAAFADDLDRHLRGEPIHARPATIVDRLRYWCRRNPIAATLFVAVTVGATAGLLSLSYLSHVFVRDTALVSTQMQAEMIEEVNALYSDIVADLPMHHVLVTPDGSSEDIAVPLPATFTIEAGKRISESKSGMQVRLYSDHPFPWRTDGGPQDDFERTALEALRADPETPYYAFGDFDGRPTLRYATARLMQTSCIGCHNTHADSPKTDWKEGDVRGVLEIIRPLHKDVRRVEMGLRGSFVIVVTVAVAALTVGVMVLVRSNAHRRVA